LTRDFGAAQASVTSSITSACFTTESGSSFTRGTGAASASITSSVTIASSTTATGSSLTRSSGAASLLSPLFPPQ